MSISHEHKPRMKRSLYRIAVPRTQIFEFKVTAASPEAACKALQRRLKYDFGAAAPDDSTLQLSTWSDPSDQGSAWFLDDGEFLKDANDKACWVWNGEKITSMRLRNL